ncbi:hypothetical protein ACIBCM_14505 [Streptomyces sp. NPDC051018]|uniref:hypothetical protein n=1 Tax=Streptomyces sp. NPDC051018 TaxID=3365639 RepID=UPI0037961796
MSTPPQPHQQPQQGGYGSPYGQQPQFPQPGPAQPGYGQPGAQQPHPSQQGYGPATSPQPFPPQQGYGAPGGWGSPRPPAPDKARKWFIGVPLAVVGAVVLAWLGYYVFLDDGESGEVFPEAKYELTLPSTLLDGKYELAGDMSQQTQEQLKNASQAVIREPKSTVAQYTSLNGAKAGIVVVSGLHGRIAEPDKALESILRGGGKAKGTTIAVPPKDYTPEGSEVRVECQVLVSDQSDGGRATIPMCAWADDNTNMSVSLATPESMGMTPAAVDLKEVAEATVKVRQEMRRPIG